MDLINYNLVNESNEQTPNYDLSGRDVTIEVHFSPEEKVCITGQIDQYIFWYSITDLADEETNQHIFDYIANGQFERVSSEYLIVGYEKADETEKWYHCRLTKSLHKGMRWETPFGSNLSEENIADHGKYFASNIQWHYRKLLEQCRFRMEGGLYLDVLHHYDELLAKETDYNQIKPLLGILEREAYLRLSPDEKVRDLYLKCVNRGRWLYNRYMDRVR